MAINLHEVRNAFIIFFERRLFISLRNLWKYFENNLFVELKYDEYTFRGGTAIKIDLSPF